MGRRICVSSSQLLKHSSRVPDIALSWSSQDTLHQAYKVLPRSWSKTSSLHFIGSSTFILRATKTNPESELKCTSLPFFGNIAVGGRWSFPCWTGLLYRALYEQLGLCAQLRAIKSSAKVFDVVSPVPFKTSHTSHMGCLLADPNTRSHIQWAVILLSPNSIATKREYLIHRCGSPLLLLGHHS